MPEPIDKNAAMLALLDALQARGAARVKLDPEGNLSEVEFTPGGAPLPPAVDTDDEPESAYELALRQVSSRSFVTPSKPSQGDA